MKNVHKCVGKKNFAEKHIQSPKGRRFQKKFGLKCSKPEGQAFSKEVRCGLFGKTEATEGCAHAVVGRSKRSTFFFECLQGFANAEYPALRNLHSPKGASFQTNLGARCSSPEGRVLSTEVRCAMFKARRAEGFKRSSV